MKKLLLSTCLALAALLPLSPACADDRIYFEVKINGQPMRLIYDTGAAQSILYRKSAERLGLKVTPRPADAPPLQPGEVPMDRTEDCDVTFNGKTFKHSFGVIDYPSYLKENVDGIQAWADIDPGEGKVFLIDCQNHIASAADLPPDIAKWMKWKIVPGIKILTFVPDGGGAHPLRMALDTGDSDGVLLSPERWKEWRAAHAKGIATLDAEWFPSTGLRVGEILRAKKIAFGKFSLGDIPVKAGVPLVYGPPGQRLDVILGLFALGQTRLIIDAKNGCVYTSPATGPAPQYAYNRLGAVFTPNDPAKDNDMLAHVAKGSPADLAGIRDGDLLLQIGDLDITQWRTDPRVLPLHRFWSQPAGTELKLLIKRGDDAPREITVTLKQPDAVE